MRCLPPSGECIHAPTDFHLHRSTARFNITYVQGGGGVRWPGVSAIVLHGEGGEAGGGWGRCTWGQRGADLHDFLPGQDPPAFLWSRTSKLSVLRGSVAPFNAMNEAFERIPHIFPTCSRRSHVKIWTLFQRAPCIWQSIVPVRCDSQRNLVDEFPTFST